MSRPDRLLSTITSALVVFGLFASGCSSSSAPSSDESATTTDDVSTTSSPSSESADTEAATSESAGPDADGFWPKPDVPEGDLDPAVSEALTQAVSQVTTGIPEEAIETIASSNDPRTAWVIVDLLRFLQGGPAGDRLIGAFSELTGAGVDPLAPWSNASNQMIGWDLPAPPGYLRWKRTLFSMVESRWTPFFEDGSDVDWRHVSWGGVLIDDRPLGDNEPCVASCIPALDDPGLTDAGGGDWYPDDGIVFGLEINGETRAYPKNIMEVHEMINDTVGGRRVGIPYCTLCGSAQAYFTDDVTGTDGTAFSPVLRTSGLLIRSNKMMFDLETTSLVDTFTGEASTGPLAAGDVDLELVSLVTSTWGEWRAAHPETTIVAEDGGIGRAYAEDPLGGRDNNGPIFPIGRVDPRLPVQEPVLGLETSDGSFIAVEVDEARILLSGGTPIVIDGISVVADAGGIRAELADGSDAGAHQAFWFAWSQFHPDTEVWEPGN